MTNLTRRVRRDYAVGIAAGLAAVTLCLGFIAFAVQVRGVDSAAHDALAVYVERAQRQPQRITTEQEVAQLVASTAYPGWRLSVSENTTRFVVRWPPGSIVTIPRTELPQSEPNLIAGIARIAGMHDAVAIVRGTELRILPGIDIDSIAYRILLAIVLLILMELPLATYISKRLADRALRPLHALHEALTHIAQTRAFATALPEPESDDLGDLIRAYNLASAAAANALEERDAAEERTHQFITDASHQLRTPLTVLSGFVGILRRGQLRSPDDGPKILEKMEQQIDIIKRLVERMMLLEGWSNDHPSCEVTDLGELVRTIVEPIGISKPERTINIATVSNARSCIDRSELTYAITNIVANAMKYAPDGAVNVAVSADAANVYVTIDDEGPGISLEEMPHIFDRFYRGNRRDVPGSGLGLAIAKAAVERAGGTIGVRSEPGKGASFTIELPRSTSSVSPVAAVT